MHASLLIYLPTVGYDLFSSLHSLGTKCGNKLFYSIQFAASNKTMALHPGPYARWNMKVYGSAGSKWREREMSEEMPEDASPSLPPFLSITLFIAISRVRQLKRPICYHYYLIHDLTIQQFQLSKVQTIS